MMKSWPPASSASTNRAPHRRRPAAIRDCRDRASVSPPVQDRWRGARSIRYQLTIAKLPLAKDLDDFDFTDTPVNAGLVRDLATGTFVADQRNVVLVGGTGTGKSHLAIAIARALIRNGTRGRFYNVVDLVNRLETETRSGKQGRLADYLNRLDFPPRENDPPDRFLVLVDPRRAWLSPLRSGRWPVAVPPDLQTLRTHVRHRHHQPHLRRMANGLRGRQDDHRATRPPHPSLRDRRNRHRVLALQKPRLTPPDLGLARLRHMTHSVGPDPNPTPQRGSKLDADRGSKLRAD